MGEALLVRRGGSGSGKKTAGDYNVGAHVYLNWNGVSTPFVVVHQGLPSSDYDSSCDGTWLLHKGSPNSGLVSDDNNVNYSLQTTLQNYLNGEYLNKFDSRISSAIKQVKIPYWNGNSVVNGASGYSTKPFLLSALEAGANPTYDNSKYSKVGSCLDFFAPADADVYNRLNDFAYMMLPDGWLRSAEPSYDLGPNYVMNGTTGAGGKPTVAYEMGWYDEDWGEYRYYPHKYYPAFIVDYKTVLED